jgi:cardiolipin synthase
MTPAPGGTRDRVLTVPNALSVVRLLLVPVFVYLLLGTDRSGSTDVWAVAILMFSGFSDWLDGKIARSFEHQASKLGELLDPAVDRLYMVVVPISFAVAGIIPVWVIAVLIVRDGLLAAMLPALRSRGLSALPVTYIGKAATFALMSAFPLILLGASVAPETALWTHVFGACGWGLLIWGIGMYLWAFVLYVVQLVLVVRQLPKVKPGSHKK